MLRSLRRSLVLLSACALGFSLSTQLAFATTQTTVELSAHPAARAIAVSGIAPRLVPPASMKVLPGTTADQTVTATDADGDPLTFLKGAGPDYMSVSTLDPGTGSATGQIHLAPPVDAVIDAVTASIVVDDGGLQDQASFTIVGADNPPVLTQPSDMTVEPSQVADQVLHASDADQDPLTFSLVRGPWFITVTTTGQGLGNAHFNPVIGDSGSYQVSVAVSDGVASDVRTFGVSVPSSTTPTFDPVKDMSVDGGQYAVQALTAHDADGQIDMFYKVSGPGYMNVGRYRPSWPGIANGFVELKPQLSDAPSPEGGRYDVPASVSASDGVHTITQSFTIHITFPPDHPPVLQQPADMTVTEGQWAQEYLNASDPDQEAITYSIANGPRFLILNYSELLAQPSYSDSGTYTVAIRATDSRGLYDEKSFQLFVLNFPAPPVLEQPLDMAVFAGRTMDQDLHASSQDGFPLTFRSDGDPAFVEISTIDAGKGSAFGRVHLAPTQADIGLVTAFVSAWGQGGGVGAYFRVQVFPLQGPRPALMEVDDPCMTPPAPAATIRILAIDPNGKPLTISQTGLPPLGTFTDNHDGTASMLLNPQGARVDTFVTVTASNGSESYSEIIGLSVGDNCSAADFGEPRNAWPVPVPGGPYAGIVGDRIVFDATRSSDPDGQSLHYAWNFGDGSVALGATPTHAYPQAGKYTVALLASDGIVTNRAETTAEITDITPARPVPMVFPNPFNGEGVLSFSVHASGHLKVAIFDIQGRLVRTIFEKPSAPAGNYDITIDGREQNGQRFASGLYFYRIETAEGVKTGRFAVMK